MHRTDDGLYSFQRYTPDWSAVHPDPQAGFEKWAAVVACKEGILPSGLAFLNVRAGLYVVFRHQGLAHTFPKTAHHIFMEWMLYFWPYYGYPYPY